MTKTFKNFGAFVKRVEKTTAWADYFNLDNKMFKIYEYGDTDGHCYVYFLNKKTTDMIRVDYTLPSINYVDSKKVEKGIYSMISAEYMENYGIDNLWR